MEVHEGEAGHYDVALLELDRDDAVSSTPVCVDPDGSVLQNLGLGDVGVVRNRKYPRGRPLGSRVYKWQSLVAHWKSTNPGAQKYLAL